MKRFYRILSAISVVALISTAFFGCSNSTISMISSSASSQSVSSESSNTTSSEPAKPTITEITWATDNYYSDTSGRTEAFCEMFEESTGVKLTLVNIPKDSYNDNIMAKFVAGDVADIVEGPKDVSSLVRQGYLIPLDSYLSDSNSTKLNSALDDALKSAYTIDDELYAVASRVGWYQCMWVRTDWMKKLGLSMPTDINSFVDMLKAFKNSDCDGNGQNDTMPLTSTNDLEMIDVIANYFGTKTNPYYDSDSKTYIDPMLTENMKEFLDFMKDLYSQGLIDQEITTNSSYSKMREKLYTGTAASCFMWEHAQYALVSGFAKNNQTDATISYVPVFNNPNGNGTFGLSYFAPDEPLCITSSCKDPQAVFDTFFNWYFTDQDAVTAVDVGVEGLDFDVVNGKAVIKEGRTLNDRVHVDSNFKLLFSLPDELQTCSDFTAEIKAQITDSNYNYTTKIKPAAGSAYYDIESDIKTKDTELIFKHIMNQISYDEYTSEYQKFDSEKGVGTTLAALNK